MIQLTQRGVTVVRDAAWDAARRTFADRHLVVLPRFVEDSLLDRLCTAVAEGEFRVNEVPSVVRELAMTKPSWVPQLFWLLLNHRDVLAAVQELADNCNDTFGGRRDVVDGAVRSFRVGRLLKLLPGRGHYSTWHSDVGGGSLIGLTVNLSEGSVGGGIEIGYTRRQVARRQLVGRGTPGFGGAVLFRIAKGLAHRGLPAAGTVPRCAFSGWFSNRADYLPPRLIQQGAVGRAADCIVLPTDAGAPTSRRGVQRPVVVCASA